MKRPCYIFDIDGTLADCSHRVDLVNGPNANWREFFAACVDDKPITHIMNVAHALEGTHDFVVFVSGRSDEVRAETERWLSKYGFFQALYMRKAGDHRPDHVVKLELLAQLRADGYEPIMAFDDRNRVVQMWRDVGIPCAQVAPGDF